MPKKEGSPTQGPGDISLTARYTAAAWEAMNLPFAGRFSDWRGRALFHSSLIAGSLLPGKIGRALFDEALRPRHLFIDSWIRENRIEQVVEIAAGYSRRGCTFASEGLRYVEVDREYVMQEKRRLCRDIPADERPLFLGIDATRPDFAERVLASCDPTLSTVIVTEGLSPYFSRTGYIELLRGLVPIAEALSAPLLTDVYMRGKAGSLLAWWMGLGATAISVIADRPYFYMSTNADIRAVFQAGGFANAEIFRPAADTRFTGGRKVRRSGWMRIVKARVG